MRPNMVRFGRENKRTGGAAPRARAARRLAECDCHARSRPRSAPPSPKVTVRRRANGYRRSHAPRPHRPRALAAAPARRAARRSAAAARVAGGGAARGLAAAGRQPGRGDRDPAGARLAHLLAGARRRRHPAGLRLVPLREPRLGRLRVAAPRGFESFGMRTIIYPEALVLPVLLTPRTRGRRCGSRSSSSSGSAATSASRPRRGSGPRSRRTPPSAAAPASRRRSPNAPRSAGRGRGRPGHLRARAGAGGHELTVEITFAADPGSGPGDGARGRAAGPLDRRGREPHRGPRGHRPRPGRGAGAAGPVLERRGCG